jgi:hypothetical protein
MSAGCCCAQIDTIEVSTAEPYSALLAYFRGGRGWRRRV